MDWHRRSCRRPAFNMPGHAHELTFTCYRRYAFLASDRTCAWLANSVDSARKSLDFAAWAYVFMPEHVHLIFFPRRAEYDVREILRAIKEPVGRQAIQYLQENAPEWLPRLTVRRGRRKERRFWQAGGGYDRNITQARTLWEMIDYLHFNPVRRGLVVRAEDWKWSSAGWLAGRQPNTLTPDPIDPALLDASPSTERYRT